MPELKTSPQVKNISPYLTPAYFDERRWAGYYLQLELLRQCGAASVLEIGYGAGVFSTLARGFGIDCKSFDNDPSVKADTHGDLRNLAEFYPPGSFECVVAFEVLEHLPWPDLKVALDAIHKVTSRWAIISVPYAGVSLGLGLNFGFRGFHQRRRCLRIPAFWQTEKDLAPEFGHYWEAGLHGFSLSRVRSVLERNFRIAVEAFHPLDKSQVFWVLERNIINQDQ